MLAVGATPNSGFMGIDSSQGTGGAAGAVGAASDAIGALGGAASTALQAQKLGTEIRSLEASADVNRANAATVDWNRNKDQISFPYQLEQMKKDLANTDEDTKLKQANALAAAAAGRLTGHNAQIALEELQQRKIDTESKQADPTQGSGWFATSLRYLNALSSAAQGTAGAAHSAGALRDTFGPPPTETTDTISHDRHGKITGHTETHRIRHR